MSKAVIHDYQSQLDVFVRRVPDYMYVFDVAKLCGYSEFVLVCKTVPISDLHKAVIQAYGLKDGVNLFFMNDATKERHVIPNTDIFTLRELVAKCQSTPNLQEFIKPLYELPTPTVYRIYFDDEHGCCGK